MGISSNSLNTVLVDALWQYLKDNGVTDIEFNSMSYQITSKMKEVISEISEVLEKNIDKLYVY